MQRLWIHILLILSIQVFFSCSSSKGYHAKPAKGGIFNSENPIPDIHTVIYHVNDSVSELHFKIHSTNLMYKKADSNQVFYAQVLVGFKVLPDINSRNILDSAARFYYQAFSKNEENPFIAGVLSFKLKSTSFAYMDLWITDKNKNIKYSHPIFINKKNNLVEQNYLLNKDGKVAYRNTFYIGETITIASAQNVGKVLSVECFLHDFNIAAPPFSLQKQDDLKYKPDSVFGLIMKQGLELVMPPKGFYHIRADVNSFEGVSIYTYEKSFPGVSDIDEMINCTRYIMRREEFDECKKATNQKEAIDNFWLTIAGSNERAKEILKKYYGRVKEANKRYTSYTQGWKTDRGMIYIIYGEPVNTYSSRNDEIWVYGPETDVNALRFVFKKTDNPFSNNDYVLQRSQTYKDSWYMAVDYWRQGKMHIQR